ncbi:inner membrane metabolite transport protein YdjE-like [Musca vetustissima]|uniref:inner membrane metabolite transport protein YdjE-like n=1 Tax=Musca vetustissima TaxID=27455 RepID=UPI002AB74103|nr:inner membrane metabolite transport protein YdjE-like [Musca vetustissima]
METNQRLAELKDYVEEENNLSTREIAKRSLVPLFKMILFRSMMLSFSNSVAVSNALVMTMLTVGVTWSPILAGCLRLAGSLASLSIMDSLGRKIPGSVWALVIAGLLIPMAVATDSWFNILDRHKMSSVVAMWISLHVIDGLFAPITSVYMGVFIFISAGMSLAQSVGWSDINADRHFLYSWFIAVALGALVSILLGYVLPKKFIMASSAVLILAGGIIFASAPRNIDALVAARYLNGMAVGLAITTYLIYASELSRNRIRGVCLGLEQFSLSLGIAIQMITTSQWDVMSSFSVNCLHGILDIIMAILAAGSLIYFIESPVDFVRLGNDTAALECLSQLQQNPSITMETNRRLEELKHYVQEQEYLSPRELLQRSLISLLKMLFFRSALLAFTYSAILTSLLAYSTQLIGFTWTPILAACLRIIGSGMTLVIIDNMGRKLPASIWALIMGGLMVPMAVIVTHSMNLLNSHKMSTVVSLWICMQFFAGLYAPVSSAYMGESFPLRTKAFCMAVCVIVEQIIQIVIISQVSIGNDGSLMAMGIMILISAAAFFVTMPETKKITLREAQERFVNLLNLKMF